MSAELMESFAMEQHNGTAEPDWATFGNPFAIPNIAGNSVIPTNPSHSLSEAIYPKDSIIHDWMTFARNHCENSDFQLLGAILPVCGAIAGRTIRMEFFGSKYPNIYSMIVAAPGHRKSTLIGFAEKLARRVLGDSAFTNSMASEEALFDQFDPDCGGNPDQFLVEDEGNALFTNWSETSYGKIVSKRYLALYDCKGWSQSFKGNKRSEGDSVKRSIPETSANLLVGATFNVCRMQRLEVRDGMWRRIVKYPSERLERKIYFGKPISGAEWNDLAMSFEQIRHEGEEPFEYVLSDEAKQLYVEYKDKNEAKLNEIPHDLNAANEARASVLSEEMSYLVKFAMIFERCRWAKLRSKPVQPLIRPDTLELAYRHLQQCNAGSDALENISKRSEIRDTSDTIRAQVLSEFWGKSVNGFIPLTRTDITNRFAKNSGRKGSMNNTRLYYEIIPDLESRNLVKVHSVKGSKKKYYLFKQED